MRAIRLVVIVAPLLATRLGVADETAPTVRPGGNMEFKVWLQLLPSRGQFQPRISFKGHVFYAAPKIVASETGEYIYRDESGEDTRLAGVSRDGSGHWALSVESSYLAFRTITNAAGNVIGWNAWDSKGTNYRFEDPGGSQFRLKTVTDANGNRTEYRHTNGRLTEIQFNFYDAANPASTAAVPASSTTYASSVVFDYDSTLTRIVGVRMYNQLPSGPWLLVRAYEIAPAVGLPTTFSEITQASGRSLVTTLEYEPNSALKAVTTPRGARYEVTRRDSSGRVASLTVSGPGLQPLTTNYWYVQSRTVSQDTITRIVRSVWWEWYKRGDTPARIDWGTETVPGVPGDSAQPPQYAAFRQRIIEHTWRVISGNCVSPQAQR